MWQRFTEKARKVVFYSQDEAQKMGEGHVCTEHLLLGLLRDGDGTALRVLKEMKIDLDNLQRDLHNQLPRGDARPNQDMTLTPRAKRVIDLAYDEARQLNNNYIGTEHLLLGLIKEEKGLAGKVLIKSGVDLEVARKATAELQDPSRADTPETRVKPEPTKDWTYQMTIGRVREWARWGDQAGDEDLTLKHEIANLQSKLETALSDSKRNLLFALCLELNEGGSLEDSQNCKDLRLTKAQVEGMAQIGAELRKLLDR
jgi:hypothetical protein